MDSRFDVEQSHLTRRTLIKRGGVGAGALFLPGILAACGSSSSSSVTASAAASDESPALTKLLDSVKSKQVIIGNYGGDTEAARKKVFWDPFTQRTGVEVISVTTPGNLGDQMLDGQVPTKWDAFHGSESESLTAQEIGKKKLPMVPAIAYESGVAKRSQPYMWQSFIVGYVPAIMKGTFKGAKPSSWADFFDTKTFPGKRSWPGEAYTTGTREAALLAAGVPPSRIYPLNLPVADAKIKSVFSDMVFYSQFPEAQSFLTSGTVAISFGPNGMWKELQTKGVDVEVLWGMTPILEVNGMNTMPDAPHLDAVQALAAYCNQPKLQAEFARVTAYGPPSKEAFKYLSASEVAQLPNAPGRTAVWENVSYLGKEQVALYADNKKLFS
jgi:putative spermidine/putrescine transport system substrate-binding protein